MDLTVNDLAARVGMTPRNIREWQTIGVLQAPQRRGRSAFYGEEHVTRIERVKSLRANGFPLDVIRQFLERSEGAAADVLSLSENVLDPASGGGTATTSREELAARFGDGAAATLEGCGLIESSEGGVVLVRDAITFGYVEQLVDLGLPVDEVCGAVESMMQHQVQAVAALVDLYRGRIWQPFVDAGLPAAKFRTIAESSGRMRELVIGVGGQIVRRATDVVIGQVAVEQATKLDSRG